MNHTEEQQVIRHAVQYLTDNLLIDARAGSGKTTTLLDALEIIPSPSTLLCAFNKRIQQELQERLPPIPHNRVVVIKTLHSLGLKVLKDYFPRLQIDGSNAGEATETLVTEAAKELLTSDGGSFPMKVRRASVRLLRTLKDVQAEAAPTDKQISLIGCNYDLFGSLNDQEIAFAIKTVALAYKRSKNFKTRTHIDYCDMVWGPVVLNLVPKSRYKVVCCDEAQDISDPQLALVQSLLVPNGRLIMVGDILQAIYAWRGAVGDTVWRKMREDYKARTLPLTVTWRCPKAVVSLANQLVPDLKPRPNAPDGKVREVLFSNAVTELGQEKESTFVLSRNNADLLHVALELWKRDVRFTLNGGKEIIEPVLWIIEKFNHANMEVFKQDARQWHKRESARAESAESSEWADRVDQQYGMIETAINYVNGPSQVSQLLRDVLGFERKTNIILSTVHKVKGLEADHVYLLKETFARYRKVKDEWGPWRPTINQEELNIEYVAITRAKSTLTWVNLE